MGHFVASTLSSGEPANLNQAWNTYRVNVFDPRQTGITTAQIEDQSLPLTNLGDRYQTPEFHAITTESAVPLGVPYVVISGEDVEMEYNPARRSKYLEALDLNVWDQELADLVIEIADNIENEVATGQLQPHLASPYDPGWFGKEVHQRVSNDLTGPQWRTNVYVNNDTLEIMKIGNEPGGNLTNTTQIDVLHVKDGYNPQRGKILDVTQVEDLYEIKTNLSGLVDRDQERRLKKILNGLDPNGSRTIKTALSPKLYVRQTNSFKPNLRYRNGLKLLGVLGAALGSVQTAHAMWTFSSEDPEFEKLLYEAKVIKRERGSSPEEKAMTWKNVPLRKFLSDRFGPEYAGLMVRALDAEAVWKVMQDL